MPPVILERPKMSRPMWDALKTHIMRERHRKKQELEADAEVERQRKERERQQKQHVLTLSETKDQISQLEGRLSELKEEKHQLFLQLKKVLNEDETRKRELLSRENEMMKLHQFNNYRLHQLSEHGGGGGGGGVGGGHHQPQMFLQPIQMTRAPSAAQNMYKVVPPSVSHHNTSPHASIPLNQIKRSRTPSPPPQSHNYKFGPFKPPPQAIPQYAHKQMGGGMQYFHPQVQVSQQAPPPQHQQHGSYPSGPHPSAGSSQPTLFAYSNAPTSRSPQQPSRDESPKHVTGPVYLPHGAPIPRGFVIHQNLDQHPNSSPHKYSDESPKYYPPPSHGLNIRGPSHLSLHPGLSIQSPQVKNVQGGSITSGYPIRTQPNVSVFQGRPPSPHVAYSVPGPGGPPRLTYGHPHGQVPQHPGVQRYSLPPGVQRD